MTRSAISRRQALQYAGLAAAATTVATTVAGTSSAVASTERSSSAASGPRAGRIDTHFHFLTKGVYDWAVLAGVVDPDDPPAWATYDLERAFGVMDANGIAVGVASYPVPAFVFRSEEVARTGVKLLNEEAARLVRRFPRRFGFFATVALEHPALAVDQAKYALDELGADGVILMTHARGNYLGHPDFEPLFRELDRRKAVVFTHPQGLPGDPGSPAGVDTAVLDFLYETSTMALNLIASGTLDRYRNVKIILSHGGGFLPYAANRIRSAGAEGWGPDPEAFDRAMRRFYFDTALPTSPNSIRTLAAVADPSHLLLGTDWPARTDDEVRDLVGAFDRDPAVDGRLRRRINRENALDLLPTLRRRLGR
ncbi:amidohydrolase family protein [Kribbella sp. NPDC048915]|uniref:amidohydrolase family protein n=1 Tax=Kribbella sp. NPDC048915 TaxID=3155148 RepID=UPI0033FCC0E9